MTILLLLLAIAVALTAGAIRADLTHQQAFERERWMW